MSQKIIPLFTVDEAIPAACIVALQEPLRLAEEQQILLGDRAPEEFASVMAAVAATSMVRAHDAVVRGGLANLFSKPVEERQQGLTAFLRSDLAEPGDLELVMAVHVYRVLEDLAAEQSMLPPMLVRRVAAGIALAPGLTGEDMLWQPGQTRFFSKAEPGRFDMQVLPASDVPAEQQPYLEGATWALYLPEPEQPVQASEEPPPSVPVRTLGVIPSDKLATAARATVLRDMIYLYGSCMAKFDERQAMNEVFLRIAMHNKGLSEHLAAATAIATVAPEQLLFSTAVAEELVRESDLMIAAQKAGTLVGHALRAQDRLRRQLQQTLQANPDVEAIAPGEWLPSQKDARTAGDAAETFSFCYGEVEGERLPMLAAIPLSTLAAEAQRQGANPAPADAAA